ncbi:MAG: RNA-binding cell elongation regulator Jag/EloR [Anaerolineae bacterium]|jgi:spoIIIJ-associated protein
MDQTRETRIFSGESVEKAIDAGLNALGVQRDQVELEVVDEGSRGLLGIGSRPAQVRLTVLTAPEPEPAAAAPAPSKPEPELASAQAKPVVLPQAPEPAAPEPSEEPDVEDVARTALRGLLDRLEFEDAEIRTVRLDSSSDEEEQPLVLDVYGSGVDQLIGRRGKTLSGLQRIVRLMVGKQLTRWVNLTVDVEGYKQRRERDLRDLARRMADRAVRGGHTVYLDPMTPYDRRIVHVTLRNRPDVRTESVGKGRGRHVTIIPTT